MKRDPFGIALAAAVVVCLGWAALEARGLARRPAVTATAADPGVVEASFRPVLEARASGRAEEALLELRERSDKGPYPGYAWFLLGEMAWEEKALGAAVQHYRKALDLDPSLSDRVSAFSSGRTLASRLKALAADPWARGRPSELPDLRYLQRRLAGGCE